MPTAPDAIKPAWSVPTPAAPDAVKGAVSNSPAAPPDIAGTIARAPAVPPSVNPNWSAPTPAAPDAVKGAVSNSPSAPPAVKAAWSAPTPAAPDAVSGGYSLPHPSAPGLIRTPATRAALTVGGAVIITATAPAKSGGTVYFGIGEATEWGFSIDNLSVSGNTILFSPVKRALHIGGTLTHNGVTALVFDDIGIFDTAYGKPLFQTGNGSEPYFYCRVESIGGPWVIGATATGARWVGREVTASPELVTHWDPEAAAAHASVVLDPAGADNQVMVTAKAAGAAAAAITAAITTPAVFTLTVTVSGNAISVAAGSKAALHLGGTLHDQDNNLLTPPVVVFQGNDTNGRPIFCESYNDYLWSVMWDPNDLCWRTWYQTRSGPSHMGSWYTGPATGKLPDDPSLTWFEEYGIGALTVTSSPPSAAAVVAAINANTAAAALVTASTRGTSTGAVAAVSATNLVYTGCTGTPTVAVLTSSTAAILLLNFGVYHPEAAAQATAAYAPGENGLTVLAPLALTALT